MAAASDSGQIGTLVRNWLHYDNLASSFYKQANKARQLRDQFEGRIIRYLETTGMKNAIIQIGGGHMSIVEERNPKTLSLVRVEELLHSYFEKRGGKDETGEIMSHIRSNRGVDVVQKLRKYGTGQPALQPLPGPTGASTH